MAQKTCIVFNKLGEDVFNGVHNWSSHTLRFYLTNVVPSASAHSVKGDIAEIATGNGYSGPVTLTKSVSRTNNVTRLMFTDPTAIAASGGPIGPFRAVVAYNDTPTSPADPLICAWDYESSITLQDGESFPIDFDGTNGVFQLTTSSAP